MFARVHVSVSFVKYILYLYLYVYVYFFSRLGELVRSLVSSFCCLAVLAVRAGRAIGRYAHACVADGLAHEGSAFAALGELFADELGKPWVACFDPFSKATCVAPRECPVCWPREAALCGPPSGKCRVK